ncbi:MAG TPA: disulfide bond formation protein B [Povalibacter sp.]|nr:disulfide bond formation protein B [Povalibacter sp.]
MTALPISRRLANGLGFLACAALMGYALYAQYVLGLEPCPLCIFQRVAVIALGVLFLIAAIHDPGRGGARVYAVLLALAALAGILVSSRHIWIQAQPPGTVAACGAGLDYMLDIMPVTDVITKVLTGSGECGKVDWRLLGLSMPWWVLISLGVLAAWAIAANVFGRGASRADTLSFAQRRR